MTFQQIVWAIDRAAEQAAASVVDAFGNDVPSPEAAWEFLNEQIYAMGEVERPAALPDFMTHQFEDDYRRHCARLAAQA